MYRMGLKREQIVFFFSQVGQRGGEQEHKVRLLATPFHQFRVFHLLILLCFHIAPNTLQFIARPNVIPYLAS
jgi:hypothetical protein